MNKHKDLLAILRHQKLRITPTRRLLLQFFLDHHSRQVSLREIHRFMEHKLGSFDRSSIWRNLDVFKRLELIQELNLPKVGKKFEYVFDHRVHHYYICKSCGKLNKGNQTLFRSIEKALKDIHGFRKANLSVVFYGKCAKCADCRR